MSIAGQMQLLGHVDGVDWYWADPARFTKGGVYYWNGKENVRLSTMPVEPVTNPHSAIRPEAVDAPLAINDTTKDK